MPWLSLTKKLFVKQPFTLLLTDPLVCQGKKAKVAWALFSRS